MAFPGTELLEVAPTVGPVVASGGGYVWAVGDSEVAIMNTSTGDALLYSHGGSTRVGVVERLPGLDNPAPTAAQGTNTTQIATTAMVQSEVALLAPKTRSVGTGLATSGISV